MPTKEELEQQKTDLERAIKQYADELANLTDDVKKEEKKAVILTLEQKREKILQQLITTLKEELATVSGEVEKGNLTALIEKYEREEWESQSLYAGVIAIIAGDTTVSGQALLRVIQEKVVSKESETETSRGIETSDTRTANSTAELLRGTETEKRLLNILKAPDFATYGPTPEKRLEVILGKVHTTIEKFLASKFALNAFKEPLPPMISTVLTPAIEWYLMDFLKQNQHDNNVGDLTLAEGISFETFTGLFSSVSTFAGKATATYGKGKSLLKAIDFLSIHSDVLSKASQSDVLRNPLKCKEFLEQPIWDTQQDIYSISLADVGITFGDEQPFGLSETDKQEVKEMIGEIEVVESPATTKLILGLVEKADPFFDKTAKLADEALDMMDKTGGVLQGFKSLGIDVFKEINTSPFLKGVLNFILSILGFTGGFEGLQKRWYRRRIDKQLDENKKSQISSIFQAYLNKTNTSPIAEKDKLTTLFKNNIKFPPNSSLFDVDGNAIIASIDEKLTDVDSLNPAVIKTVAGGAYITTTTEHVEQTKNGKTQTVKVKKESINTEKFMKDKEKIFPKYLAYMTKQLAENADYVQKVDSADTVAFTMISSLFIQPYHVIDGVQAKVFLPEAFVEQPAKTSTSDETPEQTETSNLTDEQLAKYALDITITGESRGNYGAVNKNDVDGVSLGIIQWHKERAVQLLKRLQNADATLFASLMKDPLFQDLEKAGMSVWNDAQAQQFQTLMTNEVFKQEMDKQAIEDFRGYIQQIKALGVFQPSALILLARLRNAGPERCRTKIIEPLSPEDRNNPDKIYEQFKTTAYAVKWGTGSFELAMAEVKKLPITDNVA